MKKSGHTRFISFALIILMLVSLIPYSVFAREVTAKWDTSNWKKSVENGETVYSAKSASQLNVMYMSGTTSGNCLEFDARIDNPGGSGENNIGAAYKFSDGSQYFCEYNIAAKGFRIRKITSDNPSGNQIAGYSNHELKKGQWYNFKIIFSKNYIRFYVDDKLELSVDNTANQKFKNGSMYIQGYHCAPSFKNITVSSEKVPDVPDIIIYDYDFDFNTYNSVKGFTAESGEIKWSNNALKFVLMGKNPSLTTPNITAEKGNEYSALLDVRNTVLVRMKNLTSAKKIKVYFKTSKTNEYSEENSKIFDITPRSGYKPYYFNFSDVKGATGYLRELKFVPLDVKYGSIYIDCISFEREAPIYDYAGKIDSCIANGDSVVIKGTLGENYKNQTVDLYETLVTNCFYKLNKKEKIASVKADGTKFEIKIPFVGKKDVNRLSSIFIAAVGEQRITDFFYVDNYRDYENNPYEFSLPELTVKVTDAPYKAKGDSYTDDTKAIQAAIDYVSEKGGGVVVLPGDDSYYGKRYIATSVQIKSNVELRIEEGAVLWQSPRVSDYEYDVEKGHDIVIPGIPWTHTASCHNYPLVYASKAKNVKVTGGGVIRSMDHGGEVIDGDTSLVSLGCAEKIHLVPIGFYGCENIEIRDVKLRRTNNYHINMRDCENIYIANVTMLEVSCLNSDGISATVGSKNMTLERCYIYGNDDAITICSTYNDPRGLAWWHANPTHDNCAENIDIRYCNLFGGQCITLIAWGSDNPNQEKQEIKNINVTQCILSGDSSVGGWFDNPFYGNGYTSTDVDDHSPMRDIRILGNVYLDRITFGHYNTVTKGATCATNIITDCGLTSSTKFVNGNFEKIIGAGGKSHVMGTSYWSRDIGENGSVSYSSNRKLAKKNYYGVIKGDASLYQGLYLVKGNYSVSLDTQLNGGKAYFFVADALTGEIVFKKEIAETNTFKTSEYKFSLKSTSTYYVGVEHEGTAKESVYIDNAEIKKVK